MLAIPVSVVFAVALLVGAGPGYGDAAAVQKPLRVGAFNIRTFGVTKMSNDVVAQQIKQIVERYDVILIQEIRDQHEESVYQLLRMLSLPFSFAISQPLGRTTYKEQYGFFYRTDRVSLLKVFQYQDPQDVFEREPYSVQVAPKYSTQGKMSLIALHSKPSNATAEIGHLKDVIAQVKYELGSDSEPIVLGDLNADCTYARYDKRVAANDYLTTHNATYNWLIDDDADTTVRTSTDCAYDRIIVTNTLSSHVVNESVAVFDFGQWLGLNETQALAVSDHYPVEMQLNI